MIAFDSRNHPDILRLKTSVQHCRIYFASLLHNQCDSRREPSNLCAQVFSLSFHLSQPRCQTSLTWPRSPVSTRRSWRRRRQKRKTLCPPKRVSVPLRVCFYTAGEKMLQHQQIFDTQQIQEQHGARTAHKPKLSPSFSSSAIEQERKGDATPWLLSTRRKRRWDATAKSTFFWLSQ